MTDAHIAEINEIRERYARRIRHGKASLYDPLNAVNVAFRQERERALIAMIRPMCASRPLRSLKILEIGCGSGGNIADFIRWGAAPENCIGNELLDERLEHAQATLPATVRLILGDASKLNFGDGEFDIILQSTVFSSVLDESVRQIIAKNMWRMLAQHGCVVWYDFAYNNPSNADVKGITSQGIRHLFPEATYSARKVTLAPPLARVLSKIHPYLYSMLNLVSPLRTHLVARLYKS